MGPLLLLTMAALVAVVTLPSAATLTGRRVGTLTLNVAAAAVRSTSELRSPGPSMLLTAKVGTDILAHTVSASARERKFDFFIE